MEREQAHANVDGFFSKSKRFRVVIHPNKIPSWTSSAQLLKTKNGMIIIVNDRLVRRGRKANDFLKNNFYIWLEGKTNAKLFTLNQMTNYTDLPSTLTTSKETSLLV